MEEGHRQHTEQPPGPPQHQRFQDLQQTQNHSHFPSSANSFAQNQSCIAEPQQPSPSTPPSNLNPQLSPIHVPQEEGHHTHNLSPFQLFAKKIPSTSQSPQRHSQISHLMQTYPNHQTWTNKMPQDSSNLQHLHHRRDYVAKNSNTYSNYGRQDYQQYQFHPYQFQKQQQNQEPKQQHEASHAKTTENSKRGVRPTFDWIHRQAGRPSSHHSSEKKRLKALKPQNERKIHHPPNQSHSNSIPTLIETPTCRPQAETGKLNSPDIPPCITTLKNPSPTSVQTGRSGIKVTKIPSSGSVFASFKLNDPSNNIYVSKPRKKHIRRSHNSTVDNNNVISLSPSSSDCSEENKVEQTDAQNVGHTSSNSSYFRNIHSPVSISPHYTTPPTFAASPTSLASPNPTTSPNHFEIYRPIPLPSISKLPSLTSILPPQISEGKQILIHPVSPNTPISPISSTSPISYPNQVYPKFPNNNHRNNSRNNSIHNDTVASNAPEANISSQNISHSSYPPCTTPPIQSPDEDDREIEETHIYHSVQNLSSSSSLFTPFQRSSPTKPQDQIPSLQSTFLSYINSNKPIPPSAFMTISPRSHKPENQASRHLSPKRSQMFSPQTSSKRNRQQYEEDTED